MSFRKTASLILCFAMAVMCAVCFSRDASALFSDHNSSSTVIKMPEDTPSGQYDGKYTGDEENGVPNGSGTAVFPFGTYTGEFSNGYPNGTGTYSFSDGLQVTGSFTWVENKYFYLESPLSGNSPIYCGTGINYTGMFLNGDACGYGCIDFDSGGSFYGEFRNGNLSGAGTYCYMNSSRAPITGTNWNLVNRISSDLGGRWYSGLRQDTTWKGFGMLCYNYSYYVGEVSDYLCCGYGEYWQWQASGDPSGALSLKESGTYSEGKRVSSEKPSGSGSSGSSGGSSSSSSSKKEQWCIPCGGSGNCSNCGGSGKVNNWLPGTTTFVRQDCQTCLGNGKCRSCGGDGRK